MKTNLERIYEHLLGGEENKIINVGGLYLEIAHQLNKEDGTIIIKEVGYDLMGGTYNELL